MPGIWARSQRNKGFEKEEMRENLAKRKLKVR